MDDDNFVDTRLFVSVRPVLEYKIIEVGRHAISRMLGDDDSEQTYTNLRSEGDKSLSFASLDDACTNAICSSCMTVCSMTEEYLRAMEMEWIEFLTRVHSGLRSETRMLRARMADVRRLMDKYCALKNVAVHQEIAREKSIIETQMEEMLHRYRTAELPRVHRSEELRSASLRLRNEFGSMYGRVSTKTLCRLKDVMDGEMINIQDSISRSFDRRLSELLAKRI